MLTTNQDPTQNEWTHRYDLTETTQLHVTNIKNDNMYRGNITLKHAVLSYHPVEFSNSRQIADFIGMVDFGNQTNLTPVTEVADKAGLTAGVRKIIERELVAVSQGAKSVDAALMVVDQQIEDRIITPDDDPKNYDFPSHWDENQKRNWINSRNHKRRQERNAYKG